MIGPPSVKRYDNDYERKPSFDGVTDALLGR
jgi:hypothetical protein